MKMILLLGAVVALLWTNGGCSSNLKKNLKALNSEFDPGTYGYDVNFLKKNGMAITELRDSLTGAAVLVVPAWQGRVMTSSVNGQKGKSFGWINYKFIEAGVVSHQFNPFGGEERIWLGPEGGPFSIYFQPDKQQVFSNWIVPKAIDTEPFDVAEQSARKVSFRKDFSLTNASAVVMKAGIERRVTLLTREETANALGMPLAPGVFSVAYETSNTLINKGENSWTEKTGALSIWMLSMFNPSTEGVVFIPFKTGVIPDTAPIVHDEYFGKVPADRLLVKEGILFFKVDGMHRSKIGIPPNRGLPFAGSYDPIRKALTILWYSAPETPARYVNSQWGSQTDPFSGDVVNSYNDGPVEDGSVMGPFYEIESSSPAAFLQPGEKIIHSQRIFHFSGEEADLTQITEKIFKVSIGNIKAAFMVQ